MACCLSNRRCRFEYTTVAGIALASRAAIDGGLRPDAVYDISDTMLQRLEQAQTIEEMHDILELTGIILAHAVQKSQKEKVNIACNFLKFSDNSIAEIAQYIGFQSQSNFSTVFKKWKLMSPSEYRNKNKKINFTSN